MDQYCWEIIQCDDKGTCPARYAKDKNCWEVMAENGSFQCHYGLCDECIVYLSKTEVLLFTRQEVEEVMRRRMIAPQVL